MLHTIFSQCKSNCCDSDQKMKGHLRQELDFWESNEATCSETDKTVCRKEGWVRGTGGGLEVRRRQGDEERERDTEGARRVKLELAMAMVSSMSTAWAYTFTQPLLL